MQVESRVEEFNKLLRRATAVGIERAAIFLHAECRKAVSVPNTGKTKIRVKDTTAQGGGPKGSQYTVYENPSQPGEPPHLITGTGLSNIIYELSDDPDKPAARVGVMKGGIHMAYLELGTKRVEPRPWLGLDGTLGKHLQQIARLAATGGKDEME
jgi:hypothetical protein